MFEDSRTPEKWTNPVRARLLPRRSLSTRRGLTFNEVHSSPPTIFSPPKKKKFNFFHKSPAKSLIRQAIERSSPAKRPKRSNTLSLSELLEDANLPPSSTVNEPTDFSCLHATSSNSQSNKTLTPSSKILIGDSLYHSQLCPIDLRPAAWISVTSNYPVVDQQKQRNDGLLILDSTQRFRALNAIDNLDQSNLTNLNMTEETNSTPTTSENATSSLHTASCAYVFPNIPWVQTFPRIDTRRSIDLLNEQKVPSLATIGKTVIESMQKQFAQAFKSAYTSVKTKRLPYLYFFAPNFTVLFTNFHQASNGMMIATITPTSIGMRESMKKLQIEFELLKENWNNERKPMLQATQSLLDPPNETKENDFNTPTKEDSIQWLETVGASPTITLKLRRIASTYTSMEYEEDKDFRAYTCLIKGVQNVDILYNWLLTSRLSVAITGPQAGLSPTLVTNGPFEFGTLMSAKTTVRSLQRPNRRPEYTIEMKAEPSFALLPHSILILTSLLERTALQHGDNANFTINCGNRLNYKGLNAYFENLPLNDDEGASTPKGSCQQVFESSAPQATALIQALNRSVADRRFVTDVSTDLTYNINNGYSW